LFCPVPNAPQPNEAEPDYIIYEFAELPKAIDFLASR
jgi:hypothetical protein